MPDLYTPVCDSCHVRSNAHPFPHQPGCEYGTGDRLRDAQIQMDAEIAARPWLRDEPVPHRPCGPTCGSARLLRE